LKNHYNLKPLILRFGQKLVLVFLLSLRKILPRNSNEQIHTEKRADYNECNKKERDPRIVILNWARNIRRSINYLGVIVRPTFKSAQNKKTYQRAENIVKVYVVSSPIASCDFIALTFTYPVGGILANAITKSRVPPQ